jgi:nucleoside-diphosphate-sugar epimerase
MKVLVTGGGGYIGSALTEQLLLAGHKVTVLDRFIFEHRPVGAVGLRIITGDIRDWHGLSRLLPSHDAIVHLAFISNDPAYELDPEIALSVNVAPMRPLLQAANTAGVRRFVFLSSCSVYGDSAEAVVDENAHPSPLTDYARHKLACEAIIAEFGAEQTACTILRPATACGRAPRQRLDLLLNRMAAEAAIEGRIVARRPAAVRPAVTIYDLIGAILHVLDAAEPIVRLQTFNVVSETRTVLGWARSVQTLFDRPIDIRIADEAVDRRSYNVSADKIIATGFHPRVTVRQALAELAVALRSGNFPDALTSPVFHNLPAQRIHDFRELRPIGQLG